MNITQIKDSKIFGMRVQQNACSMILIDNLINTNPEITQIIELGTGHGALSIFLAMSGMVRKAEINTFDIIDPDYIDQFSRFGITYHKIDVLSDTAQEIIRNAISKGRTFLLCDNGNKKEELLLYYKMLKEGDFLLVHDWGYEIKNKDLPKDFYDIYEPYNQADFDRFKTRILSSIKTNHKSK